MQDVWNAEKAIQFFAGWFSFISLALHKINACLFLISCDVFNLFGKEKHLAQNQSTKKILNCFFKRIQKEEINNFEKGWER